MSCLPRCGSVCTLMWHGCWPTAGAAWDRVAQHLFAAPQAIDGWVLTWLADLPAAALYALPATAADLLERGPAGQPAR